MDLKTQTPPQIDTMLSEAYGTLATAAAHQKMSQASLHYAVGDHKRYSYQGRRKVETWSLTFDEVIDFDYDSLMPWDQVSYDKAFEMLNEAEAQMLAARKEIKTLDAEYARRGGWSRFFLVPGGHIHKDMHCPTCNKMGQLTDFSWLPELSGLIEADAVAVHGAILCTVCFPSAPVEWTNGLELAEEAKKAARCSGSGKAPGKDDRPNRHHKYQPCSVCGDYQTVTNYGVIRAHKPKA